MRLTLPSLQLTLLCPTSNEYPVIFCHVLAESPFTELPTVLGFAVDNLRQRSETETTTVPGTKAILLFHMCHHLLPCHIACQVACLDIVLVKLPLPFGDLSYRCHLDVP
jgi:hypothetical protein